ncbi:hypothetical protein F5Y19DRAFT_483053 [Xylariaceae sp. FL1651]|nr:hypothetical protein F5Y19DRAFT_483053 [Xylariaceae sp. FL1651]
MNTLTESARTNLNVSVTFLVVATVAVLARLAPDSFILEILFTFIITLAKLSILWFYRNLFRASRVSSILVHTTAVACVLWFIIAILVVIIFQCHPVSAYWVQLASPGACFDTQKSQLGYELTNFFIDVTILTIPVTTIGKLQLSRPKKIVTSFMFLLGAQASASFIWSTIQAGIAIVCSCLPALGPLIGKVTKSLGFFQRRYGSRASTIKGRSGKFRDLGNGVEGDSWNASHGRRGSHSWLMGRNASDEHILQPLPPNGIVVSLQVDVV